MQISGPARVDWELRQRPHGAHGDGWTVVDGFGCEPDAREAFNEACRDRSVAAAELVMVTEVVAATHSKSERR